MNTTLQLPNWIKEKLAKIAVKSTDIWLTEQHAIYILAAEIRKFPEFASILPPSFCKKVQEQKPRELEPIERAALIIAAYDWQAIADCSITAAFEEITRLKIEAFAFGLREGGTE